MTLFYGLINQKTYNMEKKTVNAIYIEWKAMKKQCVKESSLATYTINAEKHILPALGDSIDIDDTSIQAFATSLMEQGLTTSTVKDILLVLKMILTFGYRKGWTDWREWNIRLPKDEARNSNNVLTPTEQKVMMTFLSRHFSFRNLGLYICLSTGMRIGEICALKWGDIDISSRLITVSRTIERIYTIDDDNRHTKVIISTPKTVKSNRDIPLNHDLFTILKPVMKLTNSNDYVLTNSEKPLEPRGYRRYYKRLMADIGMPQIKFHGLRHTFATRCIECNCDYKTVSSILGHANISTTLNLYVHPDMNQKRKCIDKMMKTVMKAKK